MRRVQLNWTQLGLGNLTQYVRYKKMAGKLGAKTRETPFLVAIPLFKPNPYSTRSLKLSFCKYPFLNRSFSTVLTMAQPDLQNHSPEIKEPSLKIPKLGQNGVAAEISKDPISLLRVKKLSEKAVLPSRGSPLSAGYDLSRCIYSYNPQYFQFFFIQKRMNCFSIFLHPKQEKRKNCLWGFL